MITTADFSKGTRILINGEPYQILDIFLQSPTARGGSTLVKIKARNLLDGRFVSESFKAGEKFEEADITYNNVQFLYWQGNEAVFMNGETYDQFSIDREALGTQAKYLNEDLKIKALIFNGNVVNVEIPQHVTLTVTTVEPGDKGNTASGSVTTRAELDNGMSVQAPLNIKEGQIVLIDTTNDTYYKRA